MASVCLRGVAMKKTILFAAMVLLCVNLYAQEQEKKAAVGIGLEWNMNSRDNFAGGFALAFDYALPHSLAIGLNAIGSSNFTGITVIEPAALFRWYFLGKRHNGFFVQADCGAYLIQEDGEFTAMFLGGLRGGFRFPLQPRFYIEPYGRIGYPFAFGVGVSAGIKF
jgi:hypothetical protein